MSFSLSEVVNPPRVFLVQRSKLRGRLDAEYNFALIGTRVSSVYPTFRLRDLAKSRTGGTPNKSEPSYWEGEIPWASPKDFGPFLIEDTEDHISEAAVLDSATTLVPAGSLLVVFRSGILQHSLPVAVTSKPTTINQDLKALLPIGDASAEYLAVYFVIFGKRLLPLITKSGATVQSINTAQFDELEIAVPDKQTQADVVSRLVKAFRKKARTEEQAKALLASIDDLLLAELGIPNPPEPPNTLESRMFQQRFPELSGDRFDPHYHHPKFSDLISRLESVPHFPLRELVDFSHEQWDQKSLFKETFPYIEIGAVNLELGRLTEVTTTMVSEAASRAKMLVRQGDLLISLTRPTRRAVCFSPEEFEVAVASNGFCVVRNAKKPGLSFRYLFHVLRSCLCTEQFDQRSSGGNYPAITEDQLSQILIPWVDSVKQKRIVQIFDDAYSRAEELYAQAQADLEQAKREIEAMILGEHASIPTPDMP